MSAPYDVSAMGEGGLLFQIAGPTDISAQETIWRLALEARHWPGVRETVPGVNNLLILFDPLAVLPERVARDVARAWREPGAWQHIPKHHEIPVHYGGAAGGDLARIAQATGLTPAEVIRRHASAEYVVMAVGSMPGFAYLAGMDAALTTPRLATPRQGVPRGAVMIGGAQTAVATITSPSGWSIIGHTDAAFFDIGADRPARMRPGDRLRFVDAVR